MARGKASVGMGAAPSVPQQSLSPCGALGSLAPEEHGRHGWKELWTQDGRKLYVHAASGTEQLVKPYDLAVEEEEQQREGEMHQALLAALLPSVLEKAVHQAAETLVDELVQRSCAEALEHEGLLLHGKGEYVQAMHAFLQQRDIVSHLGDALLIARSQGNIGLILEAQGDFGRAHVAHQEHLAIAREEGSQRDVSAATANVERALRLGQLSRGMIASSCCPLKILGASVGESAVRTGAIEPKIQWPLSQLLWDWELSEYADVLARYGVKSVKWLKKLKESDIRSINLPPLAERELKNLIASPCTPLGIISDNLIPPVTALDVHVIEGRDMPKMDSGPFGTCDPYLKLRCGQAEFRTHTVKGTQTPTWNESFNFDTFREDKDILAIECYDYDLASPDELIGSVAIMPPDLKVKSSRWHILRNPAKSEWNASIFLTIDPLRRQRLSKAALDKLMPSEAADVPCNHVEAVTDDALDSARDCCMSSGCSGQPESLNTLPVGSHKVYTSATTNLDCALLDLLREWDVEEHADALARYGCKSVKWLMKMREEDIAALALPTLVAKELNSKIRALNLREVQEREKRIRVQGLRRSSLTLKPPGLPSGPDS